MMKGANPKKIASATRKRLRKLNDAHHISTRNLMGGGGSGGAGNKCQGTTTTTSDSISVETLSSDTGSCNNTTTISFCFDDDKLEDATRMIQYVSVKDRKYRGKTYKRCFVGSEAVDLLVASGYADSRVEAVAIGVILARERNLFVHVVDEEKEFRDGHQFFRFGTGTTTTTATDCDGENHRQEEDVEGNDTHRTMSSQRITRQSGYARGIDQLGRGNIDFAQALFYSDLNECLRLYDSYDRDVSRTREKLGDVEMRKCEYLLALEHYEAALNPIRLQPHDAKDDSRTRLFLKCALAHRKMGDVGESDKCYENAFVGYDSSEGGWNNVGQEDLWLTGSRLVRREKRRDNSLSPRCVSEVIQE